MRVVVPLSFALVLMASLAAADPTPPAGSSAPVGPSAAAPSAEDAVAVALVALADAHADAEAIRARVKLPLRVTWKANTGEGDCTVPHSKTFTDPRQAAAALALDPRFLTALRRDQGHVHRGTGCAEESSKTPFTHGDPAIKVAGDDATVQYDLPACGAGIPTLSYALHRTGGAWSVVGYDSGCHYDES